MKNSDRIAALEAEIAALKAERDQLRAQLCQQNMTLRVVRRAVNGPPGISDDNVAVGGTRLRPLTTNDMARGSFPHTLL